MTSPRDLPLVVADAAGIARAADALVAGGLVGFPTETVYGLGADADNRAAVQAVFAAKSRPADHPVIVHVAGAAALGAWARDVPAAAYRLAARFWPGPLTIVLARRPRAHDGLTGGQDTVGLRAPSHPVAQALLAALAERRGDATAALAAPSANRFGRISPTTARHVLAEFGDGVAQVGRATVAMVLDGGPCEVGIESTIVDLSGIAPRLLRPGLIGLADVQEALQEALQPVQPLRADGAPAGGAEPAQPPPVPRVSGSLARHYAPRTPMELVPIGQLGARINAWRDRRLAVLAPAAALLDTPTPVIWRAVSPATPTLYAHRLYALLRAMDEVGADRLLVVEPPAADAWAPLHDRLRRAATGAAVDPSPL
jgi:L-threonylcarbamoyladenylate synthase